MRPHTLPSLPLNPGPRRWTLWGLSSSCWQCIGSPASQAPWCVAARGPGGWLLLAHTQPFPRVPCTHSTLLAIQVTPLWSPLWCLAAALLNVPAVLVLASRRSAAWCESEELRAEVPEAWHPPPSAPWLRWLIALPSPPPPPPLLPNRYVARREAVRLAWWVVALSFQQVNKNYTVMERFQVRVLRGGWAGRALLLHSSTCGPQLRPTHPPTPPPPWRAPQRIEHRSVNGAFLWLFTNALLFPMRFCRQAAVVPLLLAINFTLMPGICKQFHAALPAAHCLAVAALRALATMALCMAASYYLELRARRSWVLRGWQRGSARGGG